MKKILEKVLGKIAQDIVKKYQPMIIGITGSAGKTSTKEAVYSVLSEFFNVRTAIKNYNNEFGLPLTIIGGKAAGKNIFGWLAVIIRGISYIIFPRKYPAMLVLEMGSDRPGDLAKLVAIARPTVSAVTSVGAAHLEFFGSLGAIAEEKETLVRALPPDGWAVLNADDPRVAAMRAASPGRVLTCGFSETADIRAAHIEYTRDVNSLMATGLRVTVSGFSFEPLIIELPGMAGTGHVRAALFALAVAKIFRVPSAEAIRGVKKYSPPPGRMRLIPGIKDTLLIDDTYNASPAATSDALDALGTLPLPGNARRIAILGDMKELGGITERVHAETGERLVKDKIDYFVAVGEAMHEAVEAAKHVGMSEDMIMHLDNSNTAGRFMVERIKSGDIILIKGSQSMRMERAVHELMAEPVRAEELLCRQDGGWENR